VQTLAIDTSFPRMVAVKVIQDESVARLIFDSIRREMLRILSRRTLTQKDLSDLIGISPPSIDHHLKALMRGNLISVVKQEPGTHGIVQKWYRANAQVFIVDRENLPDNVRRYFMPMDIERTRGIIASYLISKKGLKFSTQSMESMTRKICSLITKAAQSYEGGVEDDPETVIMRLYLDALRHLQI
jgi:predicted transcriptional regulator